MHDLVSGPVSTRARTWALYKQGPKDVDRRRAKLHHGGGGDYKISSSLRRIMCNTNRAECGSPGRYIQSGAVYLSLDFVILFCLSCEGLPGLGFMAVVDFAPRDFETCPKYQNWANFDNKSTAES